MVHAVAAAAIQPIPHQTCTWKMTGQGNEWILRGVGGLASWQLSEVAFGYDASVSISPFGWWFSSCIYLSFSTRDANKHEEQEERDSSSSSSCKSAAKPAKALGCRDSSSETGGATTLQAGNWGRRWGPEPT